MRGLVRSTIGGGSSVGKHHASDRTCVRVCCELKPRSRSHEVASVSNPTAQPHSLSNNGNEASVGLRSQNGTHAIVTEKAEKLSPTKKADLVIVRTDGISCSREAVNGTGSLVFDSTSTHQHLLVWKTRPKCVMVIKKFGPELMDEFLKALRHLQKLMMTVVVEPDMYAHVTANHPDMDFVRTFDNEEMDKLCHFVDFIVCLGGDGVILHAAHMFRKCMPPVISFHLGSLGFLTNHRFEEFEMDLNNVVYGSADTSICAMPGMFSAGIMITLRMRLTCTIQRRGSNEEKRHFECLNEVVVDRGASPYLTNIECYERGRLITRVQADGVILATPTGSTAYSVAAGGSMVHPNVPAILMTPICPHSLTFRPVILPDYAEIELKIPDISRSQGWVSFDGRERQELQRGDAVKVRMSRHPVPTISAEDQTGDWFSSLERCFGWNDRLQQKPLSG
ncbi:hypothetical protein BSKO_04356 [Bryopsis sp. KO-2023]|nr:hypothetical protein BSKO_04356 [Bryopsis sp. KO-2023]